MPTEKMPRPAYVVDVDENSGKQVRGTVRSALKEKPKVSQQQRDPRSGKTKKPHSDSGDKSLVYAQQALEFTEEKDLRMERRKSATSTKSPRKSVRPPLSHENRTSTSGKLSLAQRSPKDNPSNYGIAPNPGYGPQAIATQAPIPIPHRPRASTSQSYQQSRPQQSYTQPFTSNTAHGPPLSMSAYYQPQPMVAPSYPPPSSDNSYMQYAAPPGTAPQDYFAQQINRPPPRPLSARFDSIPRSHQLMMQDPIARTTSAFGTRETRRQSMDGQYVDGYYEDSYASRVSDPPVRMRETIRAPSVRPRDHPDTIAMPPPPPPRPILRRPVTDYPSETETQYSDRHERHERHDRHDRHDRQLERQERPQFREPSRPRRPSTNRHSVSYDLGKDSERVRIETANNGRRRQSYYGQSTSQDSGTSGGYEDKINLAANYQEEVAGPTVPLTADMLRKQQRRQAGSSRSTNSGSRDESDYKKSATTRTTRSGSGNDDENVTIKVTGGARVMVGGTQIDCNDGGEISISRQKSLRDRSDRGSEYSTHVPQRQMIDDRRSRVDRPTGRSRMSSSHSYTRSTPQYQMDNFL